MMIDLGEKKRKEIKEYKIVIGNRALHVIKTRIVGPKELIWSI